MTCSSATCSAPTAGGCRSSPFTINTARGTTNAGMMAVVLLSLRNPDLSRRRFPLPLGANLPELDAPPWWNLKHKKTMYYDGRTPAASVRANMQFLLGEKTLEEFKALEPTFRDIQAYLLSLRAAEVSASRSTRCQGGTRQGGLRADLRPLPRHLRRGPVVSQQDRAARRDRHRPGAVAGHLDRAVEHYNATWFGEDHPVDTERVGYQAPPLDGIWASAPYLHNGSVPTLHALLESSTRPSRFTRPPSTDFEHYDTRASRLEVPRA